MGGQALVNRRKEAEASSAKAERPAGAPGARFFAIEWPRLRGYLRRMVGEQEAEDFAQEAFARVYAAEQARSPVGLLYQTARNLVFDDKRRAGRARAFLVEDAVAGEIAASHPSPEDAAHWRIRLERALAMLDEMSPKCRRVFLLRVVDGCSYAEIAQLLNISKVAVEKQLLRAYEICAAWSDESEAPAQRRTRRR